MLDGGAGADVLMGGLGDDTYIIDNVGDQVLGESHWVSRINTSSDGSQAESASYNVGLSANGGKIVFVSSASNLVAER